MISMAGGTRAEGTRVTVYVPDKSVRQGYRSLWKEMIGEIRTSKWLIWQLALRDTKTMYKQSFIGVFWGLLLPFFALGAFIVLGSAGILSLGDIDVPYPIFAILGLAFWQIFATGALACTGSLAKAGGMIGKINFPREALVIGSLGQTLIAVVIQVLAAIGFMVFYRFVPHWMVVFLPLTFIPVLLFTLGLGFILALLNSIARDLERIVGVLVPFLLFLSPVMYVKPEHGVLKALAEYNPIYYLITAPRDLVLSGSMSEPAGYLYSVIFSIALFVLAWMFFHLAETRISERV